MPCAYFSWHIVIVLPLHSRYHCFTSFHCQITSQSLKTHHSSSDGFYRLIIWDIVNNSVLSMPIQVVWGGCMYVCTEVHISACTYSQMRKMSSAFLCSLAELLPAESVSNKVRCLPFHLGWRVGELLLVSNNQ